MFNRYRLLGFSDMIVRSLDLRVIRENSKVDFKTTNYTKLDSNGLLITYIILWSQKS